MKLNSINRRKFIKLSLFSSIFLFTSGNSNEKTKSLEYKKLIIPKLNKGKLVNEIRNYDLDIKESKHIFFDGYHTDTYGINSSYLGETLKLTNKEKVAINYTNYLNESITMHGHGMHVPASQDGTAHQLIKPGQKWTSSYTVNQKACTNWYHSHKMDHTARQVYKGLSGLIIIEDEEIKKLDLPSEYGEDDIPLIVQDKFFDKKRQIYYRPRMRQIMMGYVGNIFMSNGVIDPYIDVQSKQIRFRILNGSNSSVYNLALTDDKTFKQIACDNSLLEKPVELYNLILSPGERAEIVVDFTDNIDESFNLFDKRYGKSFLKINVNKKAKKQNILPSKLTSLEKLDIKDVKRTRYFELGGRPGDLRINGLRMNMETINEKVPINDVEIWEVKNNMRMNHNFHIHATHFMIIQRNGSPLNIRENEKAYKDTVLIPGNQSVKFIVKMIDYKDEKTPYMYHCHFLEHEDLGMMGQFIVV